MTKPDRKAAGRNPARRTGAQRFRQRRGGRLLCATGGSLACSPRTKITLAKQIQRRARGVLAICSRRSPPGNSCSSAPHSKTGRSREVDPPRRVDEQETSTRRRETADAALGSGNCSVSRSGHLRQPGAASAVSSSSSHCLLVDRVREDRLRAERFPFSSCGRRRSMIP